MEITTVGLDLAKNVFQLHGVDKKGKTVLTKKLTRNKVLPFFANMAPCLIGMEFPPFSGHTERERLIIPLRRCVNERETQKVHQRV